MGVTGRADGQFLALGNLALLESLGIASAGWPARADELRAGGHTVMYLASGNTVAGLISVASCLGEETEALYYEGSRLFIAGDKAEAREQFQRVLDTKMVSFFEYEMARKLIADERWGSDSIP